MIAHEAELIEQGLVLALQRRRRGHFVDLDQQTPVIGPDGR
jgi:hypothetical protein